MDYDTYSANDAIGKGTEIYFQLLISIDINIFQYYWRPCLFSVYINLNPLLISHGTSHQSTSVSGAIIGIQNESEAGDTSIAGDSGLIMGAPIGNSGNTATGDEQVIITPTWLKSSR